MTKRRIHNHPNSCPAEFLPPLTWLSHNIISQVRNHWHYRFQDNVASDFRRPNNMSVIRAQFIAVGHGAMLFCYSNPVSFGPSTCSWLQLSPSYSTNFKKHQHCWIAASTCRKEAALNNKSHHYKVNSTQSIFFFHLFSFPVVFYFSLPSSPSLAPYFSIFKIKICQSSQDSKVGKSLYKMRVMQMKHLYIYTYIYNCVWIKDTCKNRVPQGTQK